MCSYQQNMKKPIVLIYHLHAINIQTEKKKNLNLAPCGPRNYLHKGLVTQFKNSRASFVQLHTQKHLILSY